VSRRHDRVVFRTTLTLVASVLFAATLALVLGTLLFRPHRADRSTPLEPIDPVRFDRPFVPGDVYLKRSSAEPMRNSNGRL
jgi:hypothetical protein